MYEFPVTGPIIANVNVPAGIVHFVAENRAAVQVEVEPAKNRDQDREGAANTRVEMSGNTLTIEAPQERGFNLRRSPEIVITARIPLNSRVSIKAASADAILDGRYGTVQFASASGDLRLDHVAGDLARATTSGDSQIGQIDGSLDLGMTSGDVRIGAVGGDVSSKSASGDVTIDAIGGSAKIQTASGDIRVGVIQRGDAKFSAASGDISVGVAEGTSVWLDLTTASGDTQNDLHMSGQTPEGGTATLNLAIQTASGDIRVRRVARPEQPDVRTDDVLQD